MTAQLCVCPYDHEADALQAWCRDHGLDAFALFDGSPRVPTIWRDGGRAWWVVPLPRGGEVILPVGADDDIRDGLPGHRDPPPMPGAG